MTKLSEIFKNAKKFLWDGKGTSTTYDKCNKTSERYICFAIEEYCSANGIHSKYCNSAKGIIHRRLDGCVSLEAWLYEYHRIVAHDNYVKLQETRRDWLDSLSAEYSAKGE